MKKTLFVLLILLTWYLAAMYHLVPLMALAAAELLLFLGMFALSRYLKKNLKAGFLGQMLVLDKHRESPCPVFIENTGRLPAGRLRLRFRQAYWNRPEEKSAFLYGNAGGREGQPRDIPCDSDGETADFYIDAPWCGLLTLSIDSARAYDYLSLFKVRIQAEGELRVAILPGEAPMKISFSPGFAVQLGWKEDVRPVPGNGNGEVRQLREYAPGDSYRLIHWNQTARMDDLWVKEREPEQEQTILLYLSLLSAEQRSIQELDAFFEVLHSLVTGLLAERLSVHVRWREPGGAAGGMAVDSVEDCRSMLLCLYESDSLRKGGVEDFLEREKGLCLDLNLRLFSQGREVFRFSLEKYQEQLEQTVISF